MVPSEGKALLKNPVTPPGIDPGTVRLVAQRLNHYATPGPSFTKLDAQNMPSVAASRFFPSRNMDLLRPNLSIAPQQTVLKTHF